MGNVPLVASWPLVIRRNVIAAPGRGLCSGFAAGAAALCPAGA